MILCWIEEARKAGARLRPACQELGLDPRTIQRWQVQGGGEDCRRGPKTRPANKLTDAERAEVIKVANSPAFRDLCPKQIVPRLADQGRYIASESTFYRVLRKEKQLAHRGRTKPAQPRPRPEHVATGPNQVWSWDITYLRSQIAGKFFYLYQFIDVWSRKIVASQVHTVESSKIASQILKQALRKHRQTNVKIVLHSDNGSPMKGATLRATMERLGVVASYSRPRVSDDNPYSESLFRTMKYRSNYPHRPFKSLEEARRWVADFEKWYNEQHLHSGIGFVTPEQRHNGTAEELLKGRQKIYNEARQRLPHRWNGRGTRAWDAPDQVLLNPSKFTRTTIESMTTA